jgi:hypothetical protein
MGLIVCCLTFGSNYFMVSFKALTKVQVFKFSNLSRVEKYDNPLVAEAESISPPYLYGRRRRIYISPTD